MLIIILSIVAVGLILAIILLRRRKVIPSDIDLMEGHDFEYYCAELLKKRGFQEVEVTKGSGDYGIDILAEKEGVTYAIQCKRYLEPVGIDAVQQVYAGRAFYECHVAVVLTNQTFTNAAITLADKLGVVLWDREILRSLL